MDRRGSDECPRSNRRVQEEAPKQAYKEHKDGDLLINFLHMASPTPSTIENIIHSDASSPHEYSLAAPLTTTDLEQVLQQFPDPTKSPDSNDSLASPKPLTSGLDAEEPVVVWTVTPATLMPYTVNLSDYSPMQTSDTEVHLSCAPGGPHCAELNQPCCAVCRSFCKEPGRPTNRCFCHQEAEAEARPKYVPSGDETIHNMGAVYLHPGGSTSRPHVSCLIWKDEGTHMSSEESSDGSDEENDKDFYPIPTEGRPATPTPGTNQGWTATNT